MAVAIVAAMIFVVVDQVYDFLGENVVWIVITVGAPLAPCMLAPGVLRQALDAEGGYFIGAHAQWSRSAPRSGRR